jgi:TRAP-type C4-dicarboxylate transport system permease small subunit
MLRTLSDRVAHLCLLVAAGLAFALAFLIVADVLGRSVFNRPVQGTTELVSAAIVVICFLQAPYAIRSGGMLNVDFLVTRLRGSWQAGIAVFTSLIGAGFLLFIVWGSLEPLHHAWTTDEFEGEGALRVPVWPARVVLIFGCAMGAVAYLLMGLDNLRAAMRGEGPPEPPQMGLGPAPAQH